jgi:hypothetical protein
MSQPELLLMSQKERDRLKVSRETKHGHLMQKVATGPLGLSDRRVWRLLGRMRAEGESGVVHLPE